MADQLQERDLLDSDGENRAVRCFLMMYGGMNSPTIEQMREHMEESGYPYWPKWAATERGHLTKGGAQDWIRHLFSLEPAATSSVREEAINACADAAHDAIHVAIVEIGKCNRVKEAVADAILSLKSQPAEQAAAPEQQTIANGTAHLAEWLSATVQQSSSQPTDAQFDKLEEFVGLCFQCARYERNSTDWVEAGRQFLADVLQSSAPLAKPQDASKPTADNAGRTHCGACGWIGESTSIPTGEDDGFGARGKCPDCGADEAEFATITDTPTTSHAIHTDAGKP